MDDLESKVILINEDKLYENIKDIIELNKNVTEILNKLSQKQKVHLNEFQSCITASTKIFETAYAVLRMMNRYKL